MTRALNYTVVPNDWGALEQIINDLASHIVDEGTGLPIYVLADGSREMSANWDMGSYVVTNSNFISDATAPTQPYACTSNQLNNNLNADLLDGQEGSYYAAAGGYTPKGVMYADASGDITEDATNFAWDYTNKRLGIGTATPATELDVAGDITASGTATADFFDFPTTATDGLGPPDGAAEGVITQNSTRVFHTYGTSNIFIGLGAGNFDLTGTFNSGVGSGVLLDLTSGSYNMAFGELALTNVNTGSNNFGLGYLAGSQITSGGSNTFIGSSAGKTVTTTSHNTGIGSAALSINTDHYNTAIGSWAMQSGGAGRGNTAIGFAALRNTGSSNSSYYCSALGQEAGQLITTGDNNTYLGAYSGRTNTTGSGNVFLGYYSGKYQATPSNIFLVDNQDRINAANELTNSILYGVMAATQAGQTLYINAACNIGDNDASPNRTAFAADGSQTMVGTATVWNDMQFQISDAKVTPASLLPSWEAFTTNTSEYAFSVNDEVDTSANEIPHSWKQGTAGDAHIHITTKAVPAQEEKARFTVTFAYADTNEVWVEAPLTAELTIPISTTALTNFYLDLGDITLTNYLIEAQMRCRVKRIAKSAGGTEYGGDIFITQVGIHFEEDTIGSGTETAK